MLLHLYYKAAICFCQLPFQFNSERTALVNKTDEEHHIWYLYSFTSLCKKNCLLRGSLDNVGSSFQIRAPKICFFWPTFKISVKKKNTRGEDMVNLFSLTLKDQNEIQNRKYYNFIHEALVFQACFSSNYCFIITSKEKK